MTSYALKGRKKAREFISLALIVIKSIYGSKYLKCLVKFIE